MLSRLNLQGQVKILAGQGGPDGLPVFLQVFGKIVLVDQLRLVLVVLSFELLNLLVRKPEPIPQIVALENNVAELVFRQVLTVVRDK